MKLVLSSACAAATAAALSTLEGAAAQTAEQFYKEKPVKVMVGHSPGGSYDFYARLAAEMLRKHLPGGHPIIVENKPGGGGLVAVTQFYSHGMRDGTQLAVFPETIAHSQVLEPQTAKWKVQDMTFIGSFSPVNALAIRRKDAPAKTPDEMRVKESNVGCTGVASQSYHNPAMLKVLGGFKFKMICGYPGSAEYLLALEKGEVDLVTNAWNALKVTHLKAIQAGDLVPVFQAGTKRNRELAQVPLMQELVADPEAIRAITFTSAGAAIGRALVAPPGVPVDRIAYLRDLFDKMVRDPEMIALARSRGLDLDPAPGVELQKVADEVIKAPKELIDKVARAIGG